MLNRKIAPKTQIITEIPFKKPEVISLKNGAKIYCIRETYNRTVRIDFVFDAGSLESSRVVAVLCGDLLLSGTDKKTSDEIEEAIDRLGGYLEVGTTTEHSRVSVFGLKEHIVKIVEILIDAIVNVTFDPKEIKQLIQEKRNKLEIDLKKVNVLAKRAFLSHVFQHSPYGKLSTLTDFKSTKKEDIIQFHKKNYLTGLKYLSIVGDLEDDQIDEIHELASQFDKNGILKVNYNYNYTPVRIHIPKSENLQSAIRIGKLLFNKKHPDFKKFLVLNTILGGYFGSRLMTSIREEKGYTYGIGSSVVQYLETGYFYISTEVAKEFKALTIKAIREEIELLQAEEVSTEELDLVRNYLIGEVLEQSDGAQAMMDRFISVNTFGLDLSYYNDLIHTINTITAKEIKNLAKQYLNWESMTVVTAG
ncbi:MAG: pitrilysin family protein [Brumimicrobium sp.]